MNSGIWPVYKGKSFNIWNPDTSVYYASVNAESITKHLQAKRMSAKNHSNSVFNEFDEDWITDESTLPCLFPRIAFRDITRATNSSRTLIAALLPPEIVATHQAPVLLWPRGSARDQAFLLGLMCSMIVDWYARRVVELHMTFSHFSNIPIPRANIDPSAGDSIALRVVDIAGRLAAADERFALWAEEVGVPVGSASDTKVKKDLTKELDACVAHLYGLDEDDLACLYETFDLERPDRYAEHHAAVIKHFRRLAKS